MKSTNATWGALAGLMISLACGCAAEVSSEQSVESDQSALLDGQGGERRRCRRLRRQCRRDNQASCAEYSLSCEVRIGIVGDSLSDEYQGVSAQLPGLQWTTQVQGNANISLGAFEANPEPRNDGFSLNWARFGQAVHSPQWSEVDPANVSEDCVSIVSDPRVQTIIQGDDSLEAQVDGLGAQIHAGQVDLALVWVGHNDVFIANCLGQDVSDPAFIGALVGGIIEAATQLVAYADDGLGAPRAKVAIVGLAGSVSFINPTLSAAAAAAGIPFIDSFNTATAAIITEQYANVSPEMPNGFYDVAGTPVVPFQLTFSDPPAIPIAASLDQLSPTGSGPCTSFPLGVEVCATPEYAQGFQHWDAVHPNTLSAGVIGNQILADVNATFGFAMAPVDEEQLLDNAGL